MGRVPDGAGEGTAFDAPVRANFEQHDPDGSGALTREKAQVAFSDLVDEVMRSAPKVPCGGPAPACVPGVGAKGAARRARHPASSAALVSELLHEMQACVNDGDGSVDWCEFKMKSAMLIRPGARLAQRLGRTASEQIDMYTR